MHQSESSLLPKVKSKSRATKYLQPDERWSKKQRSQDFPVFLEKIYRHLLTIRSRKTRKKLRKNSTSYRDILNKDFMNCLLCFNALSDDIDHREPKLIACTVY